MRLVKVTAPVAPETPMPLPATADVTPALVMVRVLSANAVPIPVPFAYVVEAIHEGTPPDQESTWPPVPVPKRVEVALHTGRPVAFDTERYPPRLVVARVWRFAVPPPMPPKRSAPSATLASPVPPLPTERADERVRELAAVAPRLTVLRALNIPPIVEEALMASEPVEVALAKSKFTKWEVEEAKMPAVALRTEEVATVSTPYLAVQVKGSAAPTAV